MYVLKREFGATDARSGLRRAKLASDSCMTALERRKLDKKAATLASPQLHSCSLSCFQSALSSPAITVNEGTRATKNTIPKLLHKAYLVMPKD